MSSNDISRLSKVFEIGLDCCPQTLQSDLAAEFPIYIYWPADKSNLLYSRSLPDLLNDSRVPKPLKISAEGMSFLLQSGVVPPPKSAYESIYILGVGDKAEVTTVQGKIEVSFSHSFPFMNENRLRDDEMTPHEDLILQMIAEATIARIDPSKPSFLFHSAGKDSNTIALAIAEAGYQDKVTLISHKSKGAADESEISAKIAKQLGFKHRVLQEIDKLNSDHYAEINQYFTNATLPCTDNVTLAYPLYAYQYPDLKGANIIDGGGNDVYMMTPLSKREKYVLPLAKYTSKLSFLRSYVNSESRLMPFLRTPAEWCGMSGLSTKDTQRVYKSHLPVYPHWREVSESRSSWDLVDFKTDILTTVTAAEMHIRKARIFADSIGATLILPFANEKIARYFADMPEAYLFDRGGSKNKLILRKILQKRIGLDSDEIGKMGFSYDSREMVARNLSYIMGEIDRPSTYFENTHPCIYRFAENIKISGRVGKFSSMCLYSIFLLSSYVNKCKYLRCSFVSEKHLM